MFRRLKLLTVDMLLLKLGGTLTNTLLKTIGSRLRGIAIGHEDQRTLTRVFQNAFDSAFRESLTSLNEDTFNHITSLLESFVQNETVASILIETALQKSEVPLLELSQDFSRLGYDLTTLTPNFDFDKALTAFSERLIEEFELEAAKHRSPLFNTFTVARLSAIRSKLETNQRMLQTILKGLGNLHLTYAESIKNFFHYYLGDLPQTVPFGGRSNDLDLLHHWLDEDTTPYLLLAGRAASGKSALLVHWTRSLVMANKTSVIFIPVSIRFGTNVPGIYLSALAARLSEFHGVKEMPSIVDSSANIWRGIVMALLNRRPPEGRRLLVILDGIDESADIDSLRNLFPLYPPPGVRVVASARYLAGDADARPWFVRLGWEGEPQRVKSMELRALTRDGIADVLARMELPAFHIDISRDIAAELHKATQGDPLLLRFYVDDLTKGAVDSGSSESLRLIGGGLSGYIDDYLERWRQDQQALWGQNNPLSLETVQLILNVIACALGPIRLEDLQSILAARVRLTSIDITNAVGHLRRLVIGDGFKQGYVFSHPLLGAAFYERLSQQDRKLYSFDFLNWGRRIIGELNEGALSPQSAPRYLTQFYGLHLKRESANAADKLLMVTNGWRMACEASEGLFSGFLSDVEIAWDALRGINQLSIETGDTAPFIGEEIRCAACRASINSLAGAVPPKLMSALLRGGIWTPDQTLAYAQQSSNPLQRAEALLEIAVDLQGERKEQALNTTLTTILDLKDTFGGDSDIRSRHSIDRNDTSERVRSIRSMEQLATVLPEGLMKEALHVIFQIENEWNQADAIINLASKLPAHLLEEALSFGLEMRSEGAKARLIAALSPRLPEALRLRAVEDCYSFSDIRAWATSMVALFPLLPDGDSDALRVYVEEKTVNPNRRAEAFAILAPILSSASRDGILAMARSLTKNEPKEKLLTALAPYLRSEQLDLLFDVAHSFDPKPWTESVLFEVGTLVPRPVLRSFLARIQETSNQKELMRFFAKTAANLSDDLMEDAIAMATACSSIEEKDQLFLELAPHVSQHLITRVLGALVGPRESEYMRVSILKAFSREFPVDVWEQAKAVISEINDFQQRIEVLTDFKPMLNSLFNGEEIDAMRAEVKQQPDAAWSSRTLRALLDANTEKDRIVLEQDALDTSMSIPGKDQRIDNLIQLAPILSPELRSQALLEALSSTRHIGDLYQNLRTQGELTLLGPEPNLATLLNAASQIPDHVERFRLYSWLSKYLDETGREKALESAFETLTQIWSYEEQCSALSEIISFLPGDLRERAVREVLSNPHLTGHYKTKTILNELTVSLPHFNATSFSDILEEVGSYIDDKERADVLGILVPHLPESLVRKAACIASSISSITLKSKVLAQLGPRLPKDMAEALLSEINQCESKKDQIEAMNDLLSHMQEPCRGRVFVALLDVVGLKPELTSTLTDEPLSFEDLFAMVEDSLNERVESVNENALVQLETSLEPSLELETISNLLMNLKASQLKRLLAVLRRNPESESIAPLLGLISHKLAALEEFADAIEVIQEMGAKLDEPFGLFLNPQQMMMTSLAELLPVTWLRKLLRIVKEMNSQTLKENIVASLISRLAELGEVDEALEEAELLVQPDSHVQGLLNALSYAAPERKAEIASKIISLIRIVPSVCFDYSDAFSLTSWNNDGLRATAIAATAPHIPLPLLKEATVSALGIEVAKDRERAMQALMPRFVSEDRSDLYSLWQDIISSLAGNTRERFLRDLRIMSPVVQVLGGSNGALDAQIAIEEVSGWWP